MNAILIFLFLMLIAAFIGFAGYVALAGFKDHQAKKYIAQQGA